MKIKAEIQEVETYRPVTVAVTFQTEEEYKKFLRLFSWNVTGPSVLSKIDAKDEIPSEEQIKSFFTVMHREMTVGGR